MNGSAKSMLRRVILFGVALASCGVFAWPVHALEVGPWRMLADPAPFPATFELPLGVYDAPRHRVLVVDVGWNSGAIVVHALELSPEPRWLVVTASGAAPVRAYHSSIALDLQRDRLLVVGNELNVAAGTPLGVWALTLSGAPAWERLVTQGAPGARTGHTSVYDPLHDRVLVFGGMDHYWAGIPYLSDVWSLSLDSLRWTELLPNGAGPAGREGHGAIYDPVRQRMLVFGGLFENGTRQFWNDTWALSLGDTAAWSEIEAAGALPGGRYGFGTVYDPERRRMLVHGGVNTQSNLEPDDLWALALDGVPAWEKIETEDTLRGRSFPVDVYDPIDDRFLACGGTAYPQISSLSLAAPVRWDAIWPPRPMLTPGPRTGNAVVRDPRRDRFLVVGGDYSSADSTTWSFQPDSALPWRSVGTPTVPHTAFFDHTHSVVLDSLGDQLLQFDGYQVWKAAARRPQAWEPLGPGCPGDWSSAGAGAGVVLDGRRHRLLVTGGWKPYPHSAGYSLNAIWALSLDGPPVWSFVGNLPHATADHAAYVDEAANRLVILGGYYINDTPRSRFYYGATTWSTPLDSVLNWSEHRSSSGPAPLAPPQAYSAFDPHTGRLFIATDSTLWVRDAYSTSAWDSLPLRGQRVVARSAITFDADRSQILALYGSAPGDPDMQAWAIAVGAPSVALLGAARSSNAITLRWRSVAAFGRSVTVERREEGETWQSRGPLSFPVTGIATFTDSNIEPGHDYAYRVTIAGDTTTWSSAPTLVPDASVAPFALHGARPNPSSGDFRLWFRLPDATPARLEVFDVRGRRCWRRDVGALGAGLHSLAIEGRDTWRPGVYFARLTRGTESRSARLVSVR